MLGRYARKTHHSCLDVKDGRVVKGYHTSVDLRDAGDPVEMRPCATPKKAPTNWCFWISRPLRTGGTLWPTWCGAWPTASISLLPSAAACGQWTTFRRFFAPAPTKFR